MDDRRPYAPDWECLKPSCGNVNFARRTICNRCKTPRPVSRSLEPKYANSGKGPITDLDAGDWKCSACKNINFRKRIACNRCKLPRDAHQAHYESRRGEDGYGLRDRDEGSWRDEDDKRRRGEDGRKRRDEEERRRRDEDEDRRRYGEARRRAELSGSYEYPQYREIRYEPDRRDYDSRRPVLANHLERARFNDLQVDYNTHPHSRDSVESRSFEEFRISRGENNLQRGNLHGDIRDDARKEFENLPQSPCTSQNMFSESLLDVRRSSDLRYNHEPTRDVRFALQPTITPALALTGWYFIDASRIERGPMSIEAFRQALQRGQVMSDSLCWTKSMANWTPIFQISGLREQNFVR